MPRHIFCQLAQLAEGPPGLILRSMPEDNGFEAWRLLTQRYKPNQGMKALGQLRNILNPSFPEANFEDAFLQWEAEVEKYERTFATQVQDIMKVAVVLHALSGPLQQHIQLTAGAAQTYQKVRYVILDYHRSRTHFKRTVQLTAQPSQLQGGAVPMEADAYFRGKGKGKGKKGKKGKGKGSNGTINGYENYGHGKGWTWIPPSYGYNPGKAKGWYKGKDDTTGKGKGKQKAQGRFP